MPETRLFCQRLKIIITVRPKKQTLSNAVIIELKRVVLHIHKNASREPHVWADNIMSNFIRGVTATKDRFQNLAQMRSFIHSPKWGPSHEIAHGATHNDRLERM